MTLVVVLFLSTYFFLYMYIFLISFNDWFISIYVDGSAIGILTLLFK